MKKYFRFNWVLVEELAIGPAPKDLNHLNILKKKGIVSILSLCNEDESNTPESLNEIFRYKRIPLPDHRSGRLPDLEELKKAINVLEKLKLEGPVFVHCVAAMERSPLVCMGWLVKMHKLNPQEALEYLMQIHPGTNPLAGQFNLLGKL